MTCFPYFCNYRNMQHGSPLSLNSRRVAEGTVAASLGCGNPTALSHLQPGETVLDLGSGGGFEVIPSAKRVRPTGKAYGLDMTDEMLALARDNQKKAGVKNVEFLRAPSPNARSRFWRMAIRFSGLARKIPITGLGRTDKCEPRPFNAPCRSSLECSRRATIRAS